MTAIMVGEIKVGRCTRHCSRLDRALKEGEWYYSVVLESGEGDYLRRDYSAEAWEGPPEGTLGFWKARMPVSGESKRVLAPRDVLIDLLRQMESQPEQGKLRYLLALLLLRRRIVRSAETTAPDPAAENGPSDPPTGDQDVIRIELPEESSVLAIPVHPISREESESLSRSLNDLLYCEASEIDTES